MSEMELITELLRSVLRVLCCLLQMKVDRDECVTLLNHLETMRKDLKQRVKDNS